MSLISFIEKIQNKPRHIRVQILWFSISLAMFFVVSGWVVSLKHSLSLSESKSEVLKTEESKTSPSLIESFKASIGSFFEKSKNEILNAPEGDFQTTGNEGQIQGNGVGPESPAQGKEVKPAVLPLSQ